MMAEGASPTIRVTGLMKSFRDLQIGRASCRERVCNGV